MFFLLKKVTTIALTIAGLYISIGLLLYFGQRHLLYFPTPAINHPFEEISFKIGDQAINVIVLNRGHEKAILYFGGNGESVAFNTANYDQLFSSHTVYLVNYRGYGGSTGSPTEKDICSDAQIILDKIKKSHSHISIIGRSLGTGVATYLAANNVIDKLILVTPFDSILKVAQQRFFFYPLSILLKDKYDSISRVNQIKAKTLVIIADKDEVIPNQNSLNLTQKFPTPQIEIHTLKNTSHNTISEDPSYNILLKTFLE